MQMMWRLLRVAGLLLALLGLVHASVAAEFHPYEGPQPIAVLKAENSLGGRLLHTDMPFLAVYADGTVLFEKQEAHNRTIFKTALDPAALAKLREHLAPILSRHDIKSHYSVTLVTDQSSVNLYLRDGDRVVSSWIYGLVSDMALPPPPANSGAKPRKGRPKIWMETSVPPPALLDLCRWLSKQQFPNSIEWTPKYVEVMLWDDPAGPDPALDWPANWPGPKSERTFQNNNLAGKPYSVFLDSSDLPELKEFVGRLQAGRTVPFNGKKRMLDYRYTLPSESVWEDAWYKPADVKK